MTTNPNIPYVGSCPLCSQGRHLICRDNITRESFVYCEECEATWKSPDEAADYHRVLPFTLRPCTPIDWEEMEEHPWKHYVLNLGSDRF